jgi:alginate O-acetyltransferase complex protein AlgJ
MGVNEVELVSAAEGTHRLTRERQALAELGHTRFSPGVGMTLVVAFLLTIATVPLFDSFSDVRSNASTRRTLLARGVAAERLPRQRPRSFDVLDLVPSWRQIVSAGHAGDWSGLLPKPRRLRQYEDALVLNSGAAKLTRPWVQWALTGWLGTGNEKVDIGRDGWLFYSDGFEYVTGPGFLESRRLADKADEGFQPDPRPAIQRFHDQLKQLGVTLVVFPTPEKVTIHPASFSPRARGTTIAENSSWSAFRTDLQRHEIPVFDIGPELYKQDSEGTPQFLRTDSHWSPAGVDFSARLLADYLTRQVGLPPAPRVAYSRKQLDLVRYGDLVRLLNLPPSREEILSPNERLAAWEVFTPAGSRWQREPASDILMIGDSFLEIYSSEGDGAGGAMAAGVAEQLSYYLQRPVDRIASHTWGKYGAREALGTTMEQVRKQLGDRKIVIWQFATRKLAIDDWPVMP